MTQLTTVCGRQSPEGVRLADAHAHVWISPGVPGAPVLNDEALARAEIGDFAVVGGSLLVDCQPGACGRDGRVLARLARASGVMIVASTGFHLARYYPAGVGPWALEADAAFALFRRELQQGLVDAPEVRAGVVKTAWSGEGGQEKALMEAALGAAREANCGIVVHTEAGHAVDTLVRLVEDCGFPPQRVQVSHIDKRPDRALHYDLAAAGFLLGYDTFLRTKYRPECGVWPLLRDMLAAGFSRQITLGLDLVDSVSWHMQGGPGLRWLGTEGAARLTRKGPTPRPSLLSSGVTWCVCCEETMSSLKDSVVLVTPRSFGVEDPSVRLALEAAVGEVRYNRHGRPLRAEELCATIGDVEGLLAGVDDIDASVFAAAPRLRVVARYGAGTSNIDLEAATAHGVTVTNTPLANCEAVAELTIGFMFALARAIPQAARATRGGHWPTLYGNEVAGKTVGLLGFGRIGQGVARRAAALACSVVAYDPYIDPRTANGYGARLAPLEEVIAAATFVSLHLPATAETRDLVDRTMLARMRAGSYLINTARGELVVEEDLVSALESGHIRGAALDTLRAEPPPMDHPLLHRDDVLVTPHLGAHTAEATAAMGEAALHDLLAVLAGEAPRFPVTPR